jgi:dolichyl-phosphate-mannose-protein mannosyltransferase
MLHSTAVRNRMWNSAGLFWMAWAYHYFPFYLMSRQLFIHHYLPAHLCSALVAGAVFNFILSESINYPISIPSSITRLRPRQYSDLGTQALVAMLAFVVIFIAMFLFIAPLTYGTPGFVIFMFIQPSGSRRLIASLRTKLIVVDSYPPGLYILP